MTPVNRCSRDAQALVDQLDESESTRPCRGVLLGPQHSGLGVKELAGIPSSPKHLEEKVKAARPQLELETSHVSPASKITG